MKISWLNEDCTEAIVTRGWWRPKSAEVKRIEMPEPQHPPKDGWVFANTGRHVILVDFWLAGELESCRTKELERRANDRDWLDTGRFPRAQVVGRKT